MSDEDDWDLWRQAVNPMATGFLRQALTKREDFHEARAIAALYIARDRLREEKRDSATDLL